MELCPENLTPLVDGDVLRYEIAYAAAAGWKMQTGTDDLPQWDYVEGLLDLRLQTICNNLRTNLQPVIYLTEGRTFRYDVAKRVPYKGGRNQEKPFHYHNIGQHLKFLGATVVTGIEADDQIAIDHVASGGKTVIVSRDKDLRQVPGWYHSWELGNQPSRLEFIEGDGYVRLGAKRDKLDGVGYLWFLGQCLTGDQADNIPGVPKCGPVKAYDILKGKTGDEALEAVKEEYRRVFQGNWEAEFLEQGTLLWLLRHKGQVWNPSIRE